MVKEVALSAEKSKAGWVVLKALRSDTCCVRGPNHNLGLVFFACRHKERRYDAGRRMSLLVLEWVSQARFVMQQIQMRVRSAMHAGNAVAYAYTKCTCANMKA